MPGPVQFLKARSTWIVAVLLLGVGLRAYHYLRDPVVWGDEGAILLNVMEKGYLDLLGPLRLTQAAPPLFLWIERAVFQFLGDGTLALRALPFLASCLALVLMVPLAGRLLSPPAAFWALLLFACSDRLLWHACEVKPYALDILATTVVLTVYCVTGSWSLPRRLLIFTSIAPVLLCLSFPACFVHGALLLVLLPQVWQEERAGTWLAYAVLAAAVLGTFVLLLAGPVRAQHSENLNSCWTHCFAPWDHPWMVPLWTFARTLDLGKYCCKPFGQALIPLAVVGCVVLWRRGRKDLVWLLATPLAAGWVAALMHRYPYGGYRVMVYVAPALVLLMAAGIPPTLAWLRSRSRSRPRARSRLAVAAAVAFLLIGPGLAALRVVQPWERPDTGGAAAFVCAHRQPGDPVLGNQWATEYYFRNLGPSYLTESGNLTHLTRDRLWIVWSEEADAPARHQHACGLVLPGWVIFEERQFTGVTVLLISRRPQTDAGHAGYAGACQPPSRRPY
jgi:hypothetical protein